jgi:threonylcarbamoyladenosine tRNA methylthiotransferase MtaB
MSKKIAAHTLGCKTNQYDTQAMLEQFLRDGYTQVDFEDDADVYLINTCSVTAMADKKSRQFIRRARANKEATVVVCGCMSQRDSEQVKEMGADVIIGIGRRSEALELVKKHRGESIDVVEDVSHTNYEELHITEFDATRAIIKIQEGCANFCTYCIIASLRGNPRSRSLDEIEQEAKKLADKGYKEIVITGTNLAAYGVDTGYSLRDAIDAVCKSSVERVRLGSLDPGIFDENFIKYLADNEKICRHFHISLQSGCEETLKLMGRNYTAKLYKKEIDTLRKYMSKVAISTDVMVGFAMEVEERFKESLEFVREIGFARVHVFPYSIRPGTPAAKLKGQVEKAEKHERVSRMQLVADISRDKYLSSMIGEEVEVLLETEGINSSAEGYSSEYIRVNLEDGADKLGEIVKEKLTKENLVID